MCRGTANASVPPVISTTHLLSACRPQSSYESNTSLAKQFEWPGAVHRESCLRTCGKNAAVWVEPRVEDEYWGCRTDLMSCEVHSGGGGREAAGLQSRVYWLEAMKACTGQ